MTDPELRSLTGPAEPRARALLAARAADRRPAAGQWTPADIPPPAAQPDHAGYHRLPALSWSALAKFSDPFPDGGAETFREAAEATAAMLTGTLVNRALLEVDRHPPAPARAGVIPVDARRGSAAFDIIGELVRRLADHSPMGWAFPPKPELVRVVVGPNSGKGTKGHREVVARTEDPDNELYGFLAVVPDEWGAAVAFANSLMLADPGAWARAPSPLIVRADEWELALAIAGKIFAPETAKAKVARKLLLGAAYREYFAEWVEVVEIDEPEPVKVEIPCRLMADAVGVLQGAPYVADLKAILDPAPEHAGGQLDRLARQRRYHCQLAFYRRGLASAWGCAAPEIAPFLVPVGNVPPHAVDWRPISTDLMAEAEEHVEEVFYQYALRQAGIVPWRAGWEMNDESKPIEPWRGRNPGAATIDTF